MATVWTSCFGSNFDGNDAYIAASVAQSAYYTSSTDLQNFANAIGAVAYTNGAATGTNPAWVCYKMNANQFVVGVAGITNIVQTLTFAVNQPAVLAVSGQQGNCSRWVKTAAQAISQNINSWIIANGTSANQVVYCSHSIGSPVALVLADFNISANNAIVPKNMYLFGTPRMTDGFLHSIITEKCFIFNIYSPTDPVVGYAVNAGGLNVITRDASGNQVVQRHQFGYSHAGIPYRVDLGRVYEVSRRQMSNDTDGASLAQAWLQQQTVPTHAIDTGYIERMAGAGLGTVNRRTAANDANDVRITLSNIQELPVFNISLGVQGTSVKPLYLEPEYLESNDWSGGGPYAFQPPAPSGGLTGPPVLVTPSQSTSRSTVNVRRLPSGITPAQVHTVTQRAENGDGLVKRQVKHVQQLMNAITKHDFDVANGEKRFGTEYLLNQDEQSQARLDAWFTVLSMMNEMVGKED